jgi:hypothetical protein
VLQGSSCWEQCLVALLLLLLLQGLLQLLLGVTWQLG